MSTPETPSTSAWWLLPMIAKRSPLRPSASQSSQSGLPRSSCGGEDPRGEVAQVLVVAGRRQRGAADVVLEVEVRVVDQDRAALAERHLAQLLAELRHQVQPRGDVVAELLMRRRRPLEDDRRGDVHVRARPLHVEEGRVESAEPVRGHAVHLRTRPRRPWRERSMRRSSQTSSSSCGRPSLGARVCRARPRRRSEARRAGRRAGAPAAARCVSARSRSQAAGPRRSPGRWSAASTVWARVTLVQSSRRILIPIVRPGLVLGLAGGGRARRRGTRRSPPSARSRRRRCRRCVSAECDFVSRRVDSERVVRETRRAACSQRPVRGPKASSSASTSAARSCARVLSPSRSSFCCGLRPDARDQAGRVGREALQRLRPREHHQPAGLAELAGDLRQQPVLGDPDRAAQPGLLLDLAPRSAASSPSARRGPVSSR